MCVKILSTWRTLSLLADMMMVMTLTVDDKPMRVLHQITAAVHITMATALPAAGSA